MSPNVWPVIRRGLTTMGVLAFLLFSFERAWGSGDASGFPGTSLITYTIKISLALLLLWGGSWAFLRWGPSFPKSGVSRGVSEEIVLFSWRMLGRGKVYLFGCGPDVIALWVSRKESVLLGRWSREEWAKWQEEGPSRSSSSE